MSPLWWGSDERRNRQVSCVIWWWHTPNPQTASLKDINVELHGKLDIILWETVAETLHCSVSVIPVWTRTRKKKYTGVVLNVAFKVKHNDFALGLHLKCKFITSETLAYIMSWSSCMPFRTITNVIQTYIDENVDRQKWKINADTLLWMCSSLLYKCPH